MYKRQVEAAALSDDVAEWPEGADTEIGERGISLSGGQAARLALARVCYACALAESSDPPAVALLDDPLSAVDPGVARHLVRRCVGDRLKGCAVVLCTHQLQFLAAATKVLVLDDDGTALACAPLAEIVARGGRAAALVAVDGAEDVDAAGATRARAASVSADAAAGDDGRRALVAKEDRRTGAVQARTWRRFLLGGGAALFAVVVALFLAAQVLMFWADLYVLRWSRREDGQRRRRHLAWYGALSGSTVVLGVARAVLFFALTLRSSTRLHADALTKVLDMKLAWFDMNPLGRVLNRFSSDLAQVDELLSTGLLDFGMLVLIMLSVVVACLIALPYLALLLPVLAVVTRRASRECSVSMKELKRLDGQSRSPVLSAFTASLDGLAAVRAFGIQRAQQARLVEALRVLNARVLGDRPQVHVEGTRARFKLKDGERVAVYADGLLINGGPFRPYGSPTCRAFVDDVLDGYFPAEFKDRYPDGVPFDVKDVASEQYASYGEAFGGAGRATGRRVRTLADVGDRDIAPVAPEALLAKLPASTVNADGRVVDVREAVRRRLAGDPAAPPVAFASDADDRIATLQVRTHTGTKFVVKLGYDACVGDLRAEIDARLGAAAPAYDVRTAFPARAYGDDAATLESAGLVPTAVILVQKRSP